MSEPFLTCAASMYWFPTERVTLVDGPLAGEEVDLRYGARMVTFDLVRGQHWTDWDGVEVYVTELELVSYRRADDGTWRHSRTPTSIGDSHDLRFRHEIEEEEREHHTD